MSKKKQELSDEELMALYVKGDYPAFEILYQRHSGRVFGFLQKKVDRQSAEELLQEVFLKVHRSRTQYLSQYPFLPWLFTIARNVAVDFLRRGETQVRKHTDTDLNLESLLAPSLSSPGQHNDSLAAALLTLPENPKKALELRYLNDWSFEKIAAEINTTTENSRQLVSRGVKKIRTLLRGGSQ